jgi:hypothetical protein
MMQWSGAEEWQLSGTERPGGNAAVKGWTYRRNGSCWGLNAQEERQQSGVEHAGRMAAVGG